MSYRYKQGDQIGEYVVLQTLGQGGMGEVYRVARAKDIQAADFLDEVEEFAAKICVSDELEERRRLAREVRAMQLVNHKNIIPILDHALEHDPPHFIMPLAKGSLLDEVGKLSHLEALEAFEQMCEGVAAAHAAGIVHRDLKPHNALRMPDGTVKVCDFGLVKIEPRDTTILTKTVYQLGTPLYMAPEQHIPGGARDADARVDIYALGVTISQLATGQWPTPPFTDGISTGLARVIRRATDRRDKRYETVAQMLDALRAYIAAAKAPRDPIQVFTERLAPVQDLLGRKNQFNPVSVAALLTSVRYLAGNPASLLDQFDKIPATILSVAGKVTPDELHDALDAYARALEATVDNVREWPYAETVAHNMRAVFDKAERVDVKQIAAEVSLIAGADLHRFNAWDTFTAMVATVTDDTIASAIADMLRDHPFRTYLLRQRLQGVRLHSFIEQAVRDAVREHERTVREHERST